MALYRKYRPGSFAEVVGQEQVTRPLSVALDSGRINHAYLFSGPRGCGKTSSARILARSLNCEQGPTSTPCGVCNSCVSLAPNGPGTLDVTELDAASNNGVEDMRDLRDRAVYAPAESRYRIFIIDEAHMITTSGANALLKIVEEPPEHLIFIFATTEPEKVIGTIRSRTHHYPFRLLTPQAMRGLIERTVAGEGARVEESVYPLVIRAGGGSPRDTLSVLDQLLAGSGPDGLTYEHARMLLGATDETLLDAAVSAVAAGDRAGVFEIVDDVIEAGLDPRRFATDLLDRFRDLMVLQAVPDAFKLGLVDAPTDRADILREQAGAFAEGETARLAALVNDGLSDLRGATSPRLLLEILCAKMLLPQAVPGALGSAGAMGALASGGAAGAIAGGAVSGGALASGGTQVDPAKAQAAAKYDRAAMRRAREQAKAEQAPAAQTAVEQPQGEQGQQGQQGQQGHQGQPANAGQNLAGQDLAGQAQVEQPAAGQVSADQRASAKQAAGAGGENTGAQAAQATQAAQPGTADRPAQLQPSAGMHSEQEVPATPTQQDQGSPAAAQETVQQEAAPQEPATPAGQDLAASTGEQPQAITPSPSQSPEPAREETRTHSQAAEERGVGDASQDTKQPQPVGREDVGDLDQNIRAKWADIRDTAFKLHSVTGIMLTEAKVLGFRGGTLVIGHNTGALAQRLNDPSNNGFIVQAIEQELGARVPVECVVGTNPQQQGITQRPQQAVWNPEGNAAPESSATAENGTAAESNAVPKASAARDAGTAAENAGPKGASADANQQEVEAKPEVVTPQPDSADSQASQVAAPQPDAAADPWGEPAPIGGQSQPAGPQDQTGSGSQSAAPAQPASTSTQHNGAAVDAARQSDGQGLSAGAGLSGQPASAQWRQRGVARQANPAQQARGGQQTNSAQQAPQGFSDPDDETGKDEIPLPPEPPEFEAPPEPYGYGADEGMPDWQQPAQPAAEAQPAAKMQPMAEARPRFQAAAAQQTPPEQANAQQPAPKQATSRVDLGAARQQYRERQAQQQQPQQPVDEEASRRAEEEEMIAQAASESGERDSRDALTVAMDLLAEELGARKI